MSIKSIISLAIFVILTVYFTYLNPQEIEISLTQTRTVALPLVVLMLFAVLLGVVVTALFTSWNQIQLFFKSLRQTRLYNKEQKQRKKLERVNQKAENALATGHEQKGVALFEKILEKNPNHVASLNQIGNHFRSIGKFEKAIEMHRRAVELDPENILSLDNLAQDYEVIDKPEKAIHTLARVLDLDPNSLPTLRKLRDTYMKTGNPEKAYQMQKSILPLIHEAEELNGEQELFSQIVYSRGLACYEKKRYEQAIVELKRSIRENNQSTPAYITLGDIYMECDNPKAALKIWKSGFENTRSPVCLARMKTAYDRLNKPKEISKAYHEAIRTSKNSEREVFVMQFADLLLDQDKPEEALEILEQVSEPSLRTRLLTVKALREKKDLAQAEKITQSAYDKVTSSLDNFECSNCNSTFEKWYGSCPACNSWNTVKLG